MGKYFNNPIHDDFVADFGFIEPIITKSECKVPAFVSKKTHRVALMKDFYIGPEDKNGLPGWFVKAVCTGCGKVFKNKSGFIAD